MANLYFTNASADFNWETLTNWNTAADGSGSNPAHIPWTDNGSGGAWYGDYDLQDNGTGISGATINYGTTIASGVTGQCMIAISNVGEINSGTWNAYVQNEIDSINNYIGVINGGLLTYQIFNYGTINGGTFTGSGFNNSGTINGGTFTGSGFNNSGYIYGGTFSGDNSYNNGGTIYGGTFTGSGFFNNNGYIYGGTFLPQAIIVTTSGGNTLLSMSGGPTFAYPTPASGGGGGGIDLARLIGLPPFIQL